MSSTISIPALDPATAPPSNHHLHATITLLWPYSSPHRTCALLLADPDFRLRARGGQVRVRFDGPSAEAVANAHVGIGDVVVLALDGARWASDWEARGVRTPGKGVQGELVFEGRVGLTLRRGDGREERVEADKEDVSTSGLNDSTVTPARKEGGLRRSMGSAMGESGMLYDSPAFVKRSRLSGDWLAGSGLTLFGRSDWDLEDEPKKKKQRISFGPEVQWRYEDRSSSPRTDISEDVQRQDTGQEEATDGGSQESFNTREERPASAPLSEPDLEQIGGSQKLTPTRASFREHWVEAPKTSSPHLVDSSADQTMDHSSTPQTRSRPVEVHSASNRTPTSDLQPGSSPALPDPSSLVAEVPQLSLKAQTVPTRATIQGREPDDQRKKSSGTSADAPFAIGVTQTEGEPVVDEAISAQIPPTADETDLGKGTGFPQPGSSPSVAQPLGREGRDLEESHGHVPPRAVGDASHKAAAKAPRTPVNARRPKMPRTPPSEIMAQTLRSLFGYTKAPDYVAPKVAELQPRQVDPKPLSDRRDRLLPRQPQHSEEDAQPPKDMDHVELTSEYALPDDEPAEDVEPAEDTEQEVEQDIEHGNAFRRSSITPAGVTGSEMLSPKPTSAPDRRSGMTSIPAKEPSIPNQGPPVSSTNESEGMNETPAFLDGALDQMTDADGPTMCALSPPPVSQGPSIDPDSLSYEYELTPTVDDEVSDPTPMLSQLGTQQPSELFGDLSAVPIVDLSAWSDRASGDDHASVSEISSGQQLRSPEIQDSFGDSEAEDLMDPLVRTRLDKQQASHAELQVSDVQATVQPSQDLSVLQEHSSPPARAFSADVENTAAVQPGIDDFVGAIVTQSREEETLHDISEPRDISLSRETQHTYDDHVQTNESTPSKQRSSPRVAAALFNAGDAAQGDLEEFVEAGMISGAASEEVRLTDVAMGDAGDGKISRQPTSAPSYPSLPLSPSNSQSLTETVFRDGAIDASAQTNMSRLPLTPQLTQTQSSMKVQEDVAQRPGSQLSQTTVSQKSLTAADPIGGEEYPRPDKSPAAAQDHPTTPLEHQMPYTSFAPKELLQAETMDGVQEQDDVVADVSERKPSDNVPAVDPSANDRESEAQQAQPKTPSRKSFRGRLSNVPDVISAWFSPKRSSKQLTEGEGQNGPAKVHEQSVSTKHVEITPQQSIYSARPAKTNTNGVYTSLSYFTPLARLDGQLNLSSQPVYGGNTVDIIAVVSTKTSEPVRAKAGPRDYYTVFRLSDRSLSVESSVSVEIFRPWKATLPVAQVGDVMLLRAFAVKSRKRTTYLLSTDASAWCVWRHGPGAGSPQSKEKPAWAQRRPSMSSTGVREEIKGPPVELGDEERKHAQDLRSWWLSSQGLGSNADRAALEEPTAMEENGAESVAPRL